MANFFFLTKVVKRGEVALALPVSITNEDADGSTRKVVRVSEPLAPTTTHQAVILRRGLRSYLQLQKPCYSYEP